MWWKIRFRDCRAHLGRAQRAGEDVVGRKTLQRFATE
jgi:hypothetical protein